MGCAIEPENDDKYDQEPKPEPGYDDPQPDPKPGYDERPGYGDGGQAAGNEGIDQMGNAVDQVIVGAENAYPNPNIQFNPEMDQNNVADPSQLQYGVPNNGVTQFGVYDQNVDGKYYATAEEAAAAAAAGEAQNPSPYGGAIQVDQGMQGMQFSQGMGHSGMGQSIHDGQHIDYGSQPMPPMDQGMPPMNQGMQSMDYGGQPMPVQPMPVQPMPVGGGGQQMAPEQNMVATDAHAQYPMGNVQHAQQPVGGQ